MARPTDFQFEAHCCNISGAEDELTLICRVCPPVAGLTNGYEIKIGAGDVSAIFDVIADHVHRDPTAKPCHRVIEHATRRKALEV